MRFNIPTYICSECVYSLQIPSVISFIIGALFSPTVGISMQSHQMHITLLCIENAQDLLFFKVIANKTIAPTNNVVTVFKLGELKDIRDSKNF